MWVFNVLHPLCIFIFNMHIQDIYKFYVEDIIRTKKAFQLKILEVYYYYNILLSSNIIV